MADQTVILVADTSNTGKKIDVAELTVGSNTVERQRMVLGDNTTAGNYLKIDANGTAQTGTGPLGTAVGDTHTGAAVSLNCTLTAVANKTTYLSGFSITGLGITSAASIQITTTGLLNNLTLTLPIPAGATVGVTPLNLTFNPPLPASGQNVNVVVNVPSFGTGNTVSSASAWGFNL